MSENDKEEHSLLHRVSELYHRNASSPRDADTPAATPAHADEADAKNTADDDTDSGRASPASKLGSFM